MSETLNVMGLTYLLESRYEEQMLATQAGLLAQNHHIFGRLAQESGSGYYFDFLMWRAENVSNAGDDAANQAIAARCVDLDSYFDSALEHGVIEQLQPSNLVAASAIKMLQIANTNAQPIYLVNSANWGPAITTNLVNYTSGDLSFIGDLVGAGDYPRTATTSWPAQTAGRATGLLTTRPASDPEC